MKLLSSQHPTYIFLKENGEIKIECKNGLLIEGNIEWMKEGSPEEKASDLTNQLNAFFMEKDIAITAKLIESK